MLRPLLLISFLFISNLLASQTVKWGNAQKTKAGVAIQIGWHEDNFYTIQVASNRAGIIKYTLQLEKISKNMEVLFTKDLVLPDLKEISYYEAVVLNDKIQIYVWNEDNKSRKIERFVYDLNGNFLNKNEIINIPESDAVSEAYLPLNRDRFKRIMIAVSPNKQKIAFSYVSYDKGDYKINFITFNSDGSNSLKFKEESTVEGKIYRFYFSDLAVDDFGNVALSYEINKSNPNGYERRLIIVDKKGNLIENKDMDANNYYHRTTKIKITPTNDILIANITRSIEGQDYGVALSKLTKNSLKFEPISSISLPQSTYNSQYFKSNGKPSIGVYSVDIKLNNDGGGFITADYQRFRDDIGYYNQEIIVVPFSANFTADKFTIIPKKSLFHYTSKNLSGISSFINNDELVVIYTDHVANISERKYDDMKELRSNKKAAIYAGIVGKDGSLKRKIISEENEIGGFFIPLDYQSYKGIYPICVESRTKSMYGNIKF